MEQADSNLKEQVSPTMFFAETMVLQPVETREPPLTLPMAIHHILISASVCVKDVKVFCTSSA